MWSERELLNPRGTQKPKPAACHCTKPHSTSRLGRSSCESLSDLLLQHLLICLAALLGLYQCLDPGLHLGSSLCCLQLDLCPDLCW